MQEVQLDKHIKLLDSPGVVMAQNATDTSVILRNCVKVGNPYAGQTHQAAGQSICGHGPERNRYVCDITKLCQGTQPIRL